MQTHTMMNTTVISTAVSTTDTITAITILTVQLIPAGAADGDECGVELAGDVEAAEICALVGKACVEEWCIREGSMVVGDIVALFSGGDIVGETGRGVFVGKYVFVWGHHCVADTTLARKLEHFATTIVVTCVSLNALECTSLRTILCYL